MKLNNNKMEIKNFVFSGFIKYSNYEHDEFRTLSLVDGNKTIDLVKKFRAIFDLFEAEVKVSYYISDTKKTATEIREGFLYQLVGGINADYITDHYDYSSNTNGTDYNSFLQIGGHDLFNEFSRYIDKWCVLKISLKTLE